MLVRLTINEQLHELDVAPHRSLAEVLRTDLALTGTKVAWGEMKRVASWQKGA